MFGFLIIGAGLGRGAAGIEPSCVYQADIDVIISGKTIDIQVTGRGRAKDYIIWRRDFQLRAQPRVRACVRAANGQNSELCCSQTLMFLIYLV